jgi:hypothetical protein
MTLTPPGGVTVQQMSGVTYLGPFSGAHRFIAAEQTKGELVQFDVTLSAAGAITGISNVAAIDINGTADFEGAAYTNPARNTVFLAHESATGPGVLEVNLSTGLNVQTVTIPSVITANERTNRGFESMTRSPDGAVMWTANEQALTVDGPISTPTDGTVVRLLRLDVAGVNATAGAQFAYVVEPIHGSSTLGSPQSGLSDLTLMPDGTLFALERSVAVTTPIYLSRIYEIDFAGATDVSVGPPASGLIGQTYTTVNKDLVWSGAADNSSGQNLEGLALGPRLANGSWVLFGVVDDGFNGTTDGDPLSNNTVVAFLATANPTADFNTSGDADGADFLAWQRGFGKTIGAKLTDGDGDRDGDVDAADLSLWKAAFAAPASHSVPEPAALLLAFLASMAAYSYIRRRHNKASRGVYPLGSSGSQLRANS